MSNFPQKTIGQQFAEARQAKGWTLAEAARRTNLKPPLLAALEADEFDKLPSVSNARGFIRLYARELGLDGWLLLSQFSGAADVPVDMLELEPEDLEAIPSRARAPRTATSQGIGLALIITVILVAVGVVAYKLYTVHSFSNQPPAQTIIPPAPAPLGPVDHLPVAKPMTGATPAGTQPRAEVPLSPRPRLAVPAPPPAAKGLRLQLIADADADEKSRWVRVTAIRDGREEKIYQDSLPGGGVFPAGVPWVADAFIIKMGEASAIGIIQNGGPVQKYELPGVQIIKLPVD
ncbi:MAG: helix-turn-helix domain-containing protein [Verrucomicrobiales bacterium]|jgi:transcriptional regulator with XRE-family HTH domain|nr:helix-turn-helix domain-containing protein [Verrucomicrobiales bacterium]